MLRNFLYLFSLIVILILPKIASAAYPTEKIDHFTANIIVNKDASIDVTENISVYANYEKIIHGIVRRLSTNYTDSYGVNRHTRYDIKEIRINDTNTTYHIQHDSKQLEIYIGDQNITLTPGMYFYTIQYHVNNAVNFLRDGDEIYWNITGNNWDFPIEKAQAIVQVPKNADISHYFAYTGFKGAKDQNYTVAKITANQIQFTSTTTLQPGEGLTIAAAWQKGIITQPTWIERVMQQFYFSDYVVILFALSALIYYLFAWYQYGRGPKKGTIIPLFEPPNHLTPAAMRFILRMKFDVKTFTAAIVNMAAKGYLNIQNKLGTFYLNKQNKSLDCLAVEEQIIARQIFSSGSEVALSQKNYGEIGTAKKELHKQLNSDYLNTYFVTNAKILIPGIILSLFAFATVIFSADDVEQAGAAILSLVVWTFGCAIFLNLFVNACQLAKISSSLANNKNLVSSGLFFSIFLAAEFILIYLLSDRFSFFSIFLLFLILVLNVVFYYLMKAPTIAGRKVMDQIEGFKLFFSTTERYRFQQLPKLTPELFEKYMPYAIALDLENEWTAQFEAELRNAGIDPSSYQPSYYSGPVGSLGSLPLFIAAAVSSSIAAASVSNSSSASGGGGSSGGGGGGGGGGGW